MLGSLGLEIIRHCTEQRLVVTSVSIICEAMGKV